MLDKKGITLTMSLLQYEGLQDGCAEAENIKKILGRARQDGRPIMTEELYRLIEYLR